jgi:hypothetical protein
MEKYDEKLRFSFQEMKGGRDMEEVCIYVYRYIFIQMYIQSFLYS